MYCFVGDEPQAAILHSLSSIGISTTVLGSGARPLHPCTVYNNEDAVSRVSAELNNISRVAERETCDCKTPMYLKMASSGRNMK
jgi:hypothetical protein